ncbi:phosphotransferase family protein [Microlunatus speluncae]|uniref:phosphotransferase family protein n=1 Tax=Microlunatus speluncae TaxID=2594267 RepID=UPI001375C6CF|nr:phosphotransferase [Microlunatus speluncae]
MADSEFLAELHDRFAAPRAAVAELITRSANRDLAELDRLTLGDENEVYRARLSDGAVVFARIRRPGEGTFAAESWAMDRARAAGTPIPEVLALEEIDSEHGPRPIMIITASPGRQLAEVLPSLTEARRRTVMTAIGQVLAALHSVATSGVGRPAADGSWPDREAARAAFNAERTGQRPQLLSAGLTPAEVDRAIAVIGTSPDTPAATDPVLCHGDLHSAHVFVDDDLEVCGIIDWGLWHGGSAVGELATMMMGYDRPDFEAILAGHGSDGADGPGLRQRLARSVIIQAIGHIAWHESIGNADGTAHYVTALRGALADLEG